MTSHEWKLLIAILVIFAIGGAIRESRKSKVDPIPPTDISLSPPK